MPEFSDNDQWRTLDKDLNRLSLVEYATLHVSRPLVAVGIALTFIVLAALHTKSTVL